MDQGFKRFLKAHRKPHTVFSDEPDIALSQAYQHRSARNTLENFFIDLNGAPRDKTATSNSGERAERLRSHRGFKPEEIKLLRKARIARETRRWEK